MAPCIARSSVLPFDIPIHVPFTISKETRPSAQVALVTITDAAGRTGLGECAPFPSLTGDDVTIAARVAAEVLASLANLAPTAALAWLLAHRDEVCQTSLTACVGIEMALWDLHARQLGRSLASLWGDAGVTSVATDVTLPIMAPEAVPGFWRLFAGHGFKVVKIKVSGHVEADRAMIHALLAAAPMGTKITLDGNQGFALVDARRLVERLIADGVTPLFFEQPLPADDHSGLLALQAATPVPVCLDESVQSEAEARAWVERRWGGLINLKIMKSGIAGARAIIEVARGAGVPLMIGGMLESEVAMGVSLQLACGTGAIRYADLDTPFFLTKKVTAESPWHRKTAQLVCPRGPGHGLSLGPGSAG